MIVKLLAQPLSLTCQRVAGRAMASSHREAPFITKYPQVDAIDFYLFSSCGPGRDGYVTLIANYQPVQAAYGGPNYYSLDSEALYAIRRQRRRQPGGPDVPVPLPGCPARRKRSQTERQRYRDLLGVAQYRSDHGGRRTRAEPSSDVHREGDP